MAIFSSLRLQQAAQVVMFSLSCSNERTY